MRRRPVIFAAVLCLALGLTACGDDDDSEATADAGATITIAGFNFSDASVPGGATVTVKNDDTTTHTVTSDTEGQFDSGPVGAAADGTITAPSEAGSYPFHCAIHQTTMKGTLIVTE
jgi:plastocyanin